MIVRFAPSGPLPRRILGRVLAMVVFAVLLLPVMALLLFLAPPLALVGLARVRFTDGTEIRPLWARWNRQGAPR